MTPLRPSRFPGAGGRRWRPRRGVSLVYGYVLAMLGLTLCTLAVDYGHMQIVKSELQRCADDTARGTIQTYLKYGAASAQSTAPTLASSNPVDAGFGTSPTVLITWGSWDSTAGFVAASGVPVAVKVDVSRKAAAGNAVPLLFPVFSNGQASHPSCDVGASAVAIVNTRRLIDYSGGFSTTSPLSLNGTATIYNSRLKLTSSGTSGQVASAWQTAKVPIGAFGTAFTLRFNHPDADGCCFVIQNAGTTAMGDPGTSLGYGGNARIRKSVCVKFDLYDSEGEGPDSTGMYTNGSQPTTPATDLTPSTVDLHSGDLMNVTAAYDGTTLTWTITDATTNATATASAAVNIPLLVGASTAYVGFTGATGGYTSTQEVTNWTYSITGPQLKK